MKVYLVTFKLNTSSEKNPTFLMLWFVDNKILFSKKLQNNLKFCSVVKIQRNKLINPISNHE